MAACAKGVSFGVHYIAFWGIFVTLQNFEALVAVQHYTNNLVRTTLLVIKKCAHYQTHLLINTTLLVIKNADTTTQQS